MPGIPSPSRGPVPKAVSAAESKYHAAQRIWGLNRCYPIVKVSMAMRVVVVRERLKGQVAHDEFPAHPAHRPNLGYTRIGRRQAMDIFIGMPSMIQLHPISTVPPSSGEKLVANNDPYTGTGFAMFPQVRYGVGCRRTQPWLHRTAAFARVDGSDPEQARAGGALPEVGPTEENPCL
ncbi:hypothetical protein MPRM_01220 [Mycobacterium parmense]|uniref:Uncharacterized protein n=1 Tax=Mycobacterium parmense TaxID=185642 RepID=A0A7I7YPY4_9MYCO|nr:hypothetical protein MPRM_01220 [Mycobacterium parmense]